MNTALLQSLVSFVRSRIATSERGASLVEYAFLVTLIAVVCMTAVTLLGFNLLGKFNFITSQLPG